MMDKPKSIMQLLVVKGTIPKVAPSTKNNYKYKTLTLCVLQKPVTKFSNTEAKAGS